MASTRTAPPPAGFTQSWVRSDTPPPKARRNPATQEAFEFFLNLESGKVVEIPEVSAKVAKSAARHFMAEHTNWKITFQVTTKGLTAWKTAAPEKTPAAPPAEPAPGATPNAGEGAGAGTSVSVAA